MLDKQDVVRWLTIAITAVMLTSACLVSVIFLYGGTSWQRAAQTEASTLSATELSELVGTSHYQQHAGTSDMNLTLALTKVFRIPLSNPLQMLNSQLPGVAGSDSGLTSAQSSLVTSLAHWQASTHRVALGWLPNESTAQSIQTLRDNPGINVVSPEWLELWSPTGIVKNYTDPQVVAYAHQRNIQVWAMFSNQFSAQLTHAMLSSPAARAKAVNTVRAAVLGSHLDGVNIDFENIRSSDQNAYTAFVQQLHRALSPLHASLSVDITPDIVPLQDNAAYFHAGLAAAADYVVVMAYDEHWGGDTIPGPVADLPWVTRAVTDLLNTGVPANQVILGIPSYTRFWHVYSDGSVTSKAVADLAVAGILAQHQATGQWQPQLGLFYARYPKANGYEEVWYAGPKTWTAKLNLVTANSLGGVAVWSLSLSNAHTWSMVANALRQSLS